MVSTSQSYIYEDLNPKIETQDTPESHLFIVHIPDGFARGDIGAKIEYDFGSVKVFGEKSIGSNKIMRFSEKHIVPSHCDIGNIRGKFDGKTVTVTMPNITNKSTYSMIIENKSDRKSFGESTRTRIKDMALSTTQAVTNCAKRFNEEDKQKLIYTGATILVVALSVYASYEYRSSRRP
ncbi:unnamed protein product [Lathyrus sativus]|nr:unnamed protein product [Lathyrus sativus]